MNNINTISKCLVIFGYIQLLCALICAFLFSNVLYHFSFVMFFVWLIGGIITCLITLGFAEIIEQLTVIAMNTSKSDGSKRNM